MSQPLPIFDAEGSCPKCGQEGLIEHEESESVTVGVTTTYCERPKVGLPCYRPVGRGEHLHRTCKRCGHVWFEACLPAAGMEVLQIVRKKEKQDADYII